MMPGVGRPRQWGDIGGWCAFAVAVVFVVAQPTLFGFLAMVAVVVAFGAGRLIGQRDAYEHDDWLDGRSAR